MQGNVRKVIDKREGTYANIKMDEVTGLDELNGVIAIVKPRVQLIETIRETKWEGWGTALKPANEPIVVARKPLEKGLSVAQNVLKWGIGAKKK
jgi:hypothetical protein